MKALYLTALFCAYLVHSTAQYYTYPSPYNQINQSIIETSDGGFLIASAESCYTPDEFMIEGCPVGLFLIKTTGNGDTTWTSRIINDDAQGLVNVFQNEDGTYSVIAFQDNTYICDEWVIGPDLGLLQVIVYHVSANGDILSEMAFPDNCNLYPLKSDKLNDNSIVVLAQYSEPFASDTVEARLMIVNQQGVLTHETAILVEYFLKGDIVIDSQQILLFYSDSNRVLHLNVYDESLNLLHAHTNTDTDLACLFAEDTRMNAEILSNGNIFIMCDNPYNKADNVQLFTFNEDLSLLSHHTYTIPFGANYIESADGEIVLVSEFRDSEDSSDIRLSYFTLTGDFIESRTIALPENQAPNQILELNTGDIAIVGSENCCNKSINVGPGVSFLYLESGTTAVENAADKSHAVSIYPNPVTDFIHVSWNDDDSSFEKPEMTIYSSSGQRLEQIILSNHVSIPVIHLTAGMYYLVVTDKGNIMKRERIVKLF